MAEDHGSGGTTIGKNIAVFCDGTWQHIDQPVPTNVNRLARCVLPCDGAGTPQVVRYDDGVGVGTGILDGATELIGGAFGEGLETKIFQAYVFICLNYVPGDRIFIFGFSRGAFTARSLAGLLNLVWVLRREHVDKVKQARQLYRDRRDARGHAAVAAFRASYCHPSESAGLQYVGVWDTVGELGIPATLPFAPQIDAKFRFLDTDLSGFTRSARHAMAIDERRDTYKPTPWGNIDALNAASGTDALPYGDRPYQQRWFPGPHSSVGGGHEDGGLSLCALAWIAQGAARGGLSLDPAQLAAYAGIADPCAPFDTGAGSLLTLAISRLGGEHDRAGPTDIATVSDAARARWCGRPDWRPPTLGRVAAALDALREPAADLSDRSMPPHASPDLHALDEPPKTR